jgi:hypothetical protein
MTEQRSWEELMKRAGAPIPEPQPAPGMSPVSKAVLAALVAAMVILGLYYVTARDPHPSDQHLEKDLLVAGVDPLVAYGLAHDYAWEETCSDADQWRRKILLRLVTEDTAGSDPLLTEEQARVYENSIERECMTLENDEG